jgi:ParB/RepB/Spo0J family partition protein
MPYGAPPRHEAPAVDMELCWVDPRECVQLRRNPQHMTPHDYDALVASMARDGCVEPILVRPHDDNRWEILSGNHRAMTAIDAGLGVVPAVAVDVDDEVAARLAVNLNTVHGDPEAFALATFLARSGLDGVHIDGDLRRHVAAMDSELQAALTQGRLPEQVDTRAPGR